MRDWPNRYARLVAVCICAVALFCCVAYAPPTAADKDYGNTAAASREPAVERFLLPQVDVVVDVGHGGIDGGTSRSELLEKDMNLEMARKLAEELDKRKITYALTRTGDYAPSEDNS